MMILFEPWREEIVYDNHGCPSRTDYYSTANAEGVKFTVQYTDTTRTIYIYHNYHFIMAIRGVKKTSTADYEKIIEEQFATNSELIDYWQKANDAMWKKIFDDAMRKLEGDEHD